MAPTKNRHHEDQLEQKYGSGKADYVIRGH